MYKKVMVIDDNEMDRFIAERNIKKYNFAEEVVLKESAIEALKYLHQLAATPEHFPQLIFLDIRMPLMDGFGFLEQYDKLPEVIKAKCIIMMLTTSLNPEDRKKADENKYVKRFLNKPLGKDGMKILFEDSASEKNFLM